MTQRNSFTNTLLLGGDRFTLPKCVSCKNIIGGSGNDVMCCKAFPEGIPHEVMWESDGKECKDGIKYEEEEE